MRRSRPRHDISYGPDEAQVLQEFCLIQRVDHSHTGRVTVHAEVSGIVELPTGMIVDFTKYVSIPLGVYSRERRANAQKGP